MSDLRRHRQILKLAEQLPKVYCRRLCGIHVCTAVPLTDLEHRVLTKKLGIRVVPEGRAVPVILAVRAWRGLSGVRVKAVDLSDVECGGRDGMPVRL